MEINPLLNSLKDLAERTRCLGGTFDYAEKKERLTEVELELGEPSVWDDPERAQALGRERASLELVVKTIEELESGVSDCHELLDMATEENDEESVADVATEIERLDEHLQALEFRDRKSTRLNSSHVAISYAVFCLEKKK